MKLELKALPIVDPLIPTFVRKDDWIPNSQISWTYEPKYNGFRCIIYWTRTSGPRLVSRTERNLRYIPKQFLAELHKLFLKTKQFDNLILDGELIAIDPNHITGNYHLLLDRMVHTPVLQYRCFDFLYANQKDLRAFSLFIRKKLLEKHFSQIKSLAFKLVVSKPSIKDIQVYPNLEGYLVKNLHSKYVGGVSTSWIKLKDRNPERFYVIGFVPGQGNLASTFSALKIANERLEEVGDLILGYSDQDREQIWTWILKHCKDRWRAFAVEVLYSRYTTAGKLYAPSFQKVEFPGE